MQAVQADEDVVGTSRVRELERRVRELECLLGRKTMENEILKEALDLARPKKPTRPRCPGAIRRTVPDEAIADALGVARSSLAERPRHRAAARALS